MISKERAYGGVDCLIGNFGVGVSVSPERVVKNCIEDEIVNDLLAYIDAMENESKSHQIMMKPEECKRGLRPNLNPVAIKDVIFNKPATIVFWTDGTKTIVKCQEGDTYSKETGLSLAINKKLMGKDFYEVFRKYIKED